MLLAAQSWPAYDGDCIEDFLMNQSSLSDGYFQSNTTISNGCAEGVHGQPKDVEVENEMTLVDPASQNTPTVVTSQVTEKNESVVRTNAFDVLGHRSKRRKLSPDPDSVAVPAEKAANKPRGKRQSKINSKFEDETATSAADTPKKRTPRSAKAKQSQPVPVTLVEDAHDETVVEKPCSTTPTQANEAVDQLKNSPASKPKLQVTPSQELRKSPRSVQTRTKVTMKNGKFVHELKAVMRYAADSGTGSRIQTILASPRAVPISEPQAASSKSTKLAVGKSKSTHPFFSGKKNAGETATNAVNVQTEQVEVKKPVAWSDLVFKSKQATTQIKDLQTHKPAWPPTSMQHTHPLRHHRQAIPRPSRGRKQKSKASVIPSDEDILINYAARLKSDETQLQIKKPIKLYGKARSIVHELEQSFQPHSHPGIDRVRRKANHELGWFDRADVPGPLPWTQKYGPTCWEEVFQPECLRLYEWLQSLAVHNVKQGLSTNIKPKKKRAKKKAADLDDFIVSDEEPESQKVKNAILLVGPHGCGKTAAVYAVAQQLQFEVFEMHPGMRRSQRDIAEKVGDMTQNHMVQQGPTQSREASICMDIDHSPSQEPKQAPIANFFESKVAAKSKASTPVPQRKSKEQKQSVVLFEEVDQVFEDDRGFWSGVQTLIQSSKRPVILTCNSLDDVPRQELDLVAVLDFTAVPSDIAEEYMAYVALAEGHVIDRSVIKLLYQRKNYDLRAAITELDFWCQMTLGSEKAGLDWYPQYFMSKQSTADANRTFSKGSYHDDLVRLSSTVPATEAWYRYSDIDQDLQLGNEIAENLMLNLGHLTLEESLNVCDLQSQGDLLDPSFQSTLLSTTSHLRIHDSVDHTKTPTQQTVSNHAMIDKANFFHSFRPLEIERPVFPPAYGRLAPSLDAGCSVLAADLAPYVRSIAAFDQRLETLRDQLFSSQGKKTRNTRAARAAAEGGDKASTRRERWFHAALDLDAVLQTGGDWPQYVVEDEHTELPPPVRVDKPQYVVTDDGTQSSSPAVDDQSVNPFETPSSATLAEEDGMQLEA